MAWPLRGCGDRPLESPGTSGSGRLFQVRINRRVERWPETRFSIPCRPAMVPRSALQGQACPPAPAFFEASTLRTLGAVSQLAARRLRPMSRASSLVCFCAFGPALPSRDQPGLNIMHCNRWSLSSIHSRYLSTMLNPAPNTPVVTAMPPIIVRERR